METSEKRRLPVWLQGAIVGVSLWAFVVVGAFAMEANQSRFPQWMEQADLVDTIGSVLMVIAAPIAVGGWLMIWGDGPQPPAWLTSIPFSICFGICFYGLLGSLIGLIFSKKWPHRFTIVRLVFVVACAIFLVGMVPLLC
jgi:hypothetical protein